VDQHKHAVVLLDEIEKAHADIYNILLQVMDHGSLTDALGKKVDFRNVILIMTTNAGASDSQRESIGFGRGRREGEDTEAIKRLFTPEFRNRLDAVVAFSSLSPEIIRQVVHKFVMQLEAQLADRHVTIELSEEAADWLAKNGFDELYGARPLARVIQENIKKPLADEILFGKLIKGGHVQVTLTDGKIGFEIDGPGGSPQSEEPERDPDAEASELVQ
jgi:ATP-dependent Clp protease ATP-binding subunit ClpA